MTKVVTSIHAMTAPEGVRVGYTYSEISEAGEATPPPKPPRRGTPPPATTRGIFWQSTRRSWTRSGP